MIGNNPLCFNYHSRTCFACENGRCTVLDDTSFKGDVCPFNKTREQVEIENEKGEVRRANLRR